MLLSYFKVFLRLSVATAMLSAVADRFGWYPAEITVWGSMEAFTQYTQQALFWMPESLTPFFSWGATAGEIVFGLMLIAGFKTELAAKLSGLLITSFGLSMIFSFGIKSVFDYSVFNAVGAAFAITMIKEKLWEVDNLIK